MAKKKTTKNLSKGEKVGIGVGITAAALATAGAYFLYGSKNAEKNRKKVKSWMLKAKAEVLETLEKAESMTKAEYEALVDVVAGTYLKVKDSSKAEVQAFKKEMKEHWPLIEQKGKKVVKKAVSSAKKASKKAKTATKKTIKKASKKASKKKS